MKYFAALFNFILLAIAGNICFASVDNVQYFQDINKALMARDVPKAEQIMAQWEKADPDNADLYIAKAIIDENSSSPDLERQAAYYEKAISLRPDRIDYPMHYVEGLVAVGEVDRALKIVERLLKESEDDRVVWTVNGDTVKAADKKDALLSAILPAENSLLNQSPFSYVSRFIDGVEALSNDTNLIVNMRYRRLENTLDNHAYDQALKDAKYIASNINESEKLWFLQNVASLSLYVGENDSAGVYARRVLDYPDVAPQTKKLMEKIIRRVESPGKPLEAEKFMRSELAYVASITMPSPESDKLFLYPERMVMYMRGANVVFDQEIPEIKTEGYMIGDLPVIVWTTPKEKIFPYKYVAFVPYENRYRLFGLMRSSGDKDKNGWTFEVYPTQEDDDVKFIFYDTNDGEDMTSAQFAQKVAALVTTEANPILKFGQPKDD